jgi:DNA-binding beta-propeller fold protein YncE
MTRKASKVRILLYALTFAAFALLSSAAASAQTTQTTTTTDAAVAATPAPTATPAKVVAPVDARSETDFGLASGVSGIGTDDGGNAYVALQFQNLVMKLDSGGMVLAKISTGRNPVGIIVDSLNKVFYVLNNGDNTVSKKGLDGTDIATFKVDGDGPLNGVLRGAELIFTCERSNTVVRMSTAGVQLSSTPVGARPVWVAASSGKAGEIYVSCNKDNQVWKLSSTGVVVAKYDTGRGPYGLVVNINGDFLVACSWDAVVLRHSGVTGEILSKTGVADGPSQMVAYNDAVAVASIGGNRITRLSAADGLLRSSETVNRSPSTLAASPFSLWVGCDGSGTVTRRAL